MEDDFTTPDGNWKNWNFDTSDTNLNWKQIHDDFALKCNSYLMKCLTNNLIAWLRAGAWQRLWGGGKIFIPSWEWKIFKFLSQSRFSTRIWYFARNSWKCVSFNLIGFGYRKLISFNYALLTNIKWKVRSRNELYLKKVYNDTCVSNKLYLDQAEETFKWNLNFCLMRAFYSSLG